MLLHYSPERDFSFAKYEGHLTLNGFLESFKARYQVPTKFSLVDISKLKFDHSLSPEFKKALDSLVYSKSYDPNFTRAKHGGKTAVVVANSIQEGAALAFVQLFNDIGKVRASIRSFKSESDAIRWLVEEGMQPEHNAYI